MSELFWQAKIWGLLHNSPLKALHKNDGSDKDNVWQALEVIRTWRDLGGNSEASSNPVLKHIHLADLIVSASDRPISYRQTTVRTLQILLTHV